MKTPRQTVKPLPEVVDYAHRPFIVTESPQARVTLVDPCKFHVPFGTDRYLRDQRSHELAHIRWTPTDLTPGQYAKQEKVNEQYLQVCEDARVNYLATCVGVDLQWMSEPKSARAMIQLGLDSAPLDNLVCFAVARASCKGEYRLIKRLYNAHPKGRAAMRIAAQTLSFCENRDFGGSLSGARYLQSVFAKADELAAPPTGFDDKLAPMPLDMTDPDVLGELLAHASDKARTGVRANKWGEMLIDSPPRFTPCNSALKSLRPRPTDTGLFPRAVHRLPIDGMIFAQKRKTRQGGSVLIDMSGSMNLPFHRVADWLKDRPLATVAVYSGAAKKGVLTILAKDGKRVDEGVSSMGGNVIDGPAIRWLARQPAPRLWVSDGNVTGCNDNDVFGGYDECQSLCRVYRIQQLKRFQDLLTWTRACRLWARARPKSGLAPSTPS